MDRIKYDAYKIKIQAIDPDRDRSMREVYGLSPEEAEWKQTGDAFSGRSSGPSGGFATLEW